MRLLLLLAVLAVCDSAKISAHGAVNKKAENLRSALSSKDFKAARQSDLMPHALSLSSHLSQRDYSSSISKRKKAHRKLAGKNPELTPLFPGYGTHYSYVYVGTPPQRQSLIVDTGSHWTAFPCTGCTQCGTHTDNYFATANSSTIKTFDKCEESKKINNKFCPISQTYAEGSSWNAVQMNDQLWVGDIEKDLLPGADAFSVDFTFGCQTKETGLFRSQLADGIMGMSNSDDTIPRQLQKQGVFDSSTFALCLRVGGGIMTLGGVDTRIHEKNDIQYAPMTPEPKAAGFFGLQMVDLLFVPSSGAAPMRATLNSTFYNMGKGAILDSGTTDTYLPKAIARDFKERFKTLTGIDYSEDDVVLTAQQIAKLPDLAFKFKTATGTIQVTMPWTDYLDKVEDGKYNFRIYLTEKAGVVLGANFMQNYNVIFDSENQRIGFAKAVCNYEPFEPLVYGTDEGEDEPWGGHNGSPTTCDFVPYTECTARCDKDDAAYKATGLQDWVNRCEIDAGDVQARPCSENCTQYKIVRGDPHCPDKPWTDCSHACIKSRQAVPRTEPLYVGGKCNYQLQTSTCYAGACPLHDGDYLLYLDMRVRVEPWKWSYVYTESFYAAMTSLFKLKIDTIELLNDAGSEYTSGTKLHFKIRLKAKDYADTKALHDAADAIVVQVRRADFGARLVEALDATGQMLDGPQISRFGWLFNEDIEVLSAIAMPIGDIRDPYGEVVGKHEYHDDDGNSSLNMDLLLLGVAIAAVLVLVVVLYLHMRLRHEHALYEKDKGTLGRSGEALTKMWAQFTSGRGAGAGAGVGTGAGGRGGEVEMRGLMKPIDEDLED